MRALGQDYGDGDVWAAVNIRNRYIPVAEVGLDKPTALLRTVIYI